MSQWATPDMQIVRKKLTATEITPPNVRWDDTCECVQQTFDGGVTWVDAPGLDPRSSDTYRAPPLESDDLQCDAAANMVAYLHTAVDMAIAFDSSVRLATELLALLGFSLGPAVGAIVAVILLIADVLLALGAEAIDGAFTESVYDDLLCVFYNNIDADGQMSDAQLSDIYTAVAAGFDSNVQVVFGAISSGLGPVGWSNFGAKGTHTGDCTACAGCPGCFEWNFALDTQGFETCSVGGWTDGYFHQACVGDDATMNIGVYFGATPAPGVTHVEMDLSLVGGDPQPTDWYIYGTAVDTGLCGGSQTLLASGTITGSGTVSGDCASQDVYAFQLITSTIDGCTPSDCLLTAFRATSTDWCAVGLSPNC